MTTLFACDPPKPVESESSGSDTGKSSSSGMDTGDMTGAESSSGTGTDTDPDTDTDSETDTDTDTDIDSDSDTAPNGDLPDIDMTLVTDQMTESAYTETRTFAPDDCAIEEACVNGPGERRLLRFTTITPNVGDGDFVVGSPELNPEDFEFGTCHGHYHFSGFAAYRLLDAESNVVATGHKMAFALIDLAQFWDAPPGPQTYPMDDGTQGISVGWSDIYDAGLDCQWIDITGVAAGNYVLEVSINPDQTIVESNFANNIVLLNVEIGESDPVEQPLPEQWTCSPDFYDGGDGCDCGCGAFDPDCQNPTADACQFCGNEGSCSAEQGCGAIDANNNAVCAEECADDYRSPSFDGGPSSSLTDSVVPPPTCNVKTSGRA